MAQPSGVGGRDSNTQNPTPKVLGRRSLSLGASEEKEHGKYLLRPRGTYAGVQVRRGQVRVRGVCPCACVCVCARVCVWFNYRTSSEKWHNNNLPTCFNSPQRKCHLLLSKFQSQLEGQWTSKKPPNSHIQTETILKPGQKSFQVSFKLYRLEALLFHMGLSENPG